MVQAPCAAAIVLLPWMAAVTEARPRRAINVSHGSCMDGRPSLPCAMDSPCERLMIGVEAIAVATVAVVGVIICCHCHCCHPKMAENGNNEWLWRNKIDLARWNGGSALAQNN